MADPVKRLNYFKGQFLTAADFNDEQAYHVARRRAHNRLLHTWGIADGLEVSFKAGDRRLTIAPGYAIDALGQEIVLPETAQTAEVSGSAGKTVTVTIAYGESQTDPPSTDTTTGATGDTRWTEAPVIKVDEAPPADRSLELVLARVTVGADGSVSAVDDGVDPYRRRSAGVVGGDLQVTSLTLTDPNRAVAQWTGLRLGGANRADFAGSLTVAGNLGVGTTSPSQTLTVQNANAAYLNVRDGTREILLGADANGGIVSVMSAHDLILRAGSNTERMRVTAAGNVGIGTNAPRARLEVAGAITPAAGATEASGIMFPKDPAGGTGDAAWMRYYARPGGSGEDMTLEIGVSDNAADHIMLNPSGGVGIKRVPEYTLDINGSVRLGNFTPADQDEWPVVAWIRDAQNNWDEGLIKHGSARGLFGRAGFGFHMHESREFGIWSTNWNPLLAVQGGTGNVSMRGGLFLVASDHKHTGIGNTAGYAAIENDSGTYNALMILGRTVSTNPLKRVVALWDQLTVHGVFTNPNTDIAERFKFGEALSPGEVVVFDAERGELELCRRPADKRVIGIVSAQPAVILGTDEAEAPVALCGRVMCKVDADIAPVEAGDLLTTSATPGHAQKVLDPAAAVGCIMGKALQPLAAGRGEILVLVLLQ